MLPPIGSFVALATFATSFSVVANQKVVEMLPIILANSFNCSKWSSKVFNEDRIEGTMTFSIPVGQGKKSPQTKNEVLGGQRS
jgi:hypothetical protein